MKKILSLIAFAGLSTALNAESVYQEFKDIVAGAQDNAQEEVQKLHADLDEAIGHFEGAAQATKMLKKHVANAEVHHEIAKEAHDEIGPKIKGKTKSEVSSYRGSAVAGHSNAVAHVKKVKDAAKMADDKTQKALKDSKKTTEENKQAHDKTKKALQATEHDSKDVKPEHHMHKKNK